MCLRKRWCQLAGRQQVGKRKREGTFQLRLSEHLTQFHTEHLEPGTHGNSMEYAFVCVCVREGKGEAGVLPFWCHQVRIRQPDHGVPTMHTWDNDIAWLSKCVCVYGKYNWKGGGRRAPETVRYRDRGVEVGVWTLGKEAQHKENICVLPSPVISLPTTGRSVSKSTLSPSMYLLVSIPHTALVVPANSSSLSPPLFLYVYPLSLLQTSSLVRVLRDRKCL